MNIIKPYLPAALLLAAVLVLTLWICHQVTAARARKERDRTRTLETLLQPKETVKLICRSKGGRWILTGKRLIIEEKSGYTALPFRKLKRLQGHTPEGKITAAPDKMTSLTVQGEKTYTLHRVDEAFVPFVWQLKGKISPKRKKK